MRERGTKEEAAKGVTRAIIDSSREQLTRIIKLLNEADLGFGDLLPRKVNEDAEKNFAIFIFFNELLALPNIFHKQTASELRDLSILEFTDYLKVDKEYLIKQLEEYQEIFDELVRVGLDPWITSGGPNLTSRLLEKIGFRKKKIKLATLEIDDFDPLLVLFFNTHLIIGRWKYIAEKYEIV